MRPPTHRHTGLLRERRNDVKMTRSSIESEGGLISSTQTCTHARTHVCVSMRAYTHGIAVVNTRLMQTEMNSGAWQVQMRCVSTTHAHSHAHAPAPPPHGHDPYSLASIDNRKIATQVNMLSQHAQAHTCPIPTWACCCGCSVLKIEIDCGTLQAFESSEHILALLSRGLIAVEAYSRSKHVSPLEHAWYWCAESYYTHQRVLPVRTNTNARTRVHANRELHQIIQ